MVVAVMGAGVMARLAEAGTGAEEMASGAEQWAEQAGEMMAMEGPPAEVAMAMVEKEEQRVEGEGRNLGSMAAEEATAEVEAEVGCRSKQTGCHSDPCFEAQSQSGRAWALSCSRPLVPSHPRTPS